MPSDKPKVVSYLGVAEKQVFDKFCSENNYSNSQGVAHLIQEQLIESRKTNTIDAEKVKLLVNSIMPLEQIEKTSVLATGCAKLLENHSDRILNLQEQLNKLAGAIAELIPDYFLDEEIAAVTGRREQEVYEWRMGLRKPRGTQVLKKLEPYEIKDGRWVKRKH